MKKKLGVFLVVPVLVFLCACERQTTPLEPGTALPDASFLQAQRIDSLSGQEGPGVVIGEAPHTVVEVEIEITGSFRPGEPLQAAGLAVPNMPARDLRLKIWSPELEFAKISGFGESYRIQKGLSIPSLIGTQLSGELAQQGHRISTEITIPSPGIYELIVSAVAEPLVMGFRVNETVHRSVWLLIDERGGKLLPEFDESEIPEGYRKESGPFRSALASGGGTALGAGPERSSSYGEIQVYMYYTDMDDSTTVAVDRGRIFVVEKDYVLGDTTLIYNTYTDSDGLVTIECTGSYSRMDLYPALDGDEVDISTFSATRENVSCDDPATELNINAGAEGELFMNYQYEIIPDVESTFSDSRSRIDVRYNSSSGTSRYNSSDYIEIFSNAVWGTGGYRAQIHEFGHAFHEKALGGNEGSGECPTPHYYSLKTNYRCAFSEGFAEFVPFVLGYGFATDSHRYDRPCLVWESGQCTSWGSYGVGLLETEGQVAHFLNDITDSSNSESYDEVTISYAHLADIYETCQVNKSGWKRPWKIHWLTHCIQKAIDGYWESFPSADEPTAYTVTAGHSPDFDDVRQLWRTHFFDKSTLYDPLSASITGDDAVNPEEECAWQAFPDGGLAPFSYAWTGALTGSGFTIDGEVSSSSWLYVTVTDSLSNQAYDSFYIDVDENEECEW